MNARVTKFEGRKYFCKLCLSKFPTQTHLDSHYEMCLKNENIKVVMPKEDEKYHEFKDYNKQMRVPYALYCDFEALVCETNEEIKENQNTFKYQNHILSIYALSCIR